MKRTLALAAALLILLSASACKGGGKGDKLTAESVAALAQEKAEQYSEKENPIAVIVTDKGEAIVMELYPDQAPQTVKNFISLANSTFYDGLIFHRVIAGFMIQGGDPNGDGSGGPGYEIFGEFSNNGFNNEISHKRGVVSMARRGSQVNPASMYNTAGSQFFICVADKSYLDGDYAAFGFVLEGMDAVDRIVQTPTDSGDRPLEDQVMKYVRVFENGALSE